MHAGRSGAPCAGAAGHAAPVGLLVSRCVPSAAGAARCCGGRAGGTLAAFLYSPIMVRPARLPGLPGVASGGRGCRGIRRPCWRCAGAWLPCSGRGWLYECGKRHGRCPVKVRNTGPIRRYGCCRGGSGWLRYCSRMALTVSSSNMIPALSERFAGRPSIRLHSSSVLAVCSLTAAVSLSSAGAMLWSVMWPFYVDSRSA